jgi:hypothetical protein
MFGSKYRKLEEDVSRLKAIGIVSILNDKWGGGARNFLSVFNSLD